MTKTQKIIKYLITNYKEENHTKYFNAIIKNELKITKILGMFNLDQKVIFTQCINKNLLLNEYFRKELINTGVI